MLNEFDVSKFRYLNISLRIYSLWYQIIFCIKGRKIVYRLGRGDLKFSFTKHTQWSVSMRTVHHTNSSGLRYRWHCDGKMKSSEQRSKCGPCRSSTGRPQEI